MIKYGSIIEMTSISLKCDVGTRSQMHSKSPHYTTYYVIGALLLHTSIIYLNVIR